MTRARSPNLCTWHRSGIPAAYLETAFFVANCARCQEKLAAGLVSADAPSPGDLYRAFRANPKRQRFGTIGAIVRRRKLKGK